MLDSTQWSPAGASPAGPGQFLSDWQPRQLQGSRRARSTADVLRELRIDSKPRAAPDTCPTQRRRNPLVHNPVTTLANSPQRQPAQRTHGKSVSPWHVTIEGPPCAIKQFHSSIEPPVQRCNPVRQGVPAESGRGGHQAWPAAAALRAAVLTSATVPVIARRCRSSPPANPSRVPPPRARARAPLESPRCTSLLPRHNQVPDRTSRSGGPSSAGDPTGPARAPC